MRTTQIKIAQYVGSQYDGDIIGAGDKERVCCSGTRISSDSKGETAGLRIDGVSQTGKHHVETSEAKVTSSG